MLSSVLVLTTNTQVTREKNQTGFHHNLEAFSFFFSFFHMRLVKTVTQQPTQWKKMPVNFYPDYIKN